MRSSFFLVFGSKQGAGSLLWAYLCLHILVLLIMLHSLHLKSTYFALYLNLLCNLFPVRGRLFRAFLGVLALGFLGIGLKCL